MLKKKLQKLGFLKGSIIISFAFLCFLILMPIFIPRVQKHILIGFLFGSYMFLPIFVVHHDDSKKKRLMKLFVIHLPAILIYAISPLIFKNYYTLTLGFIIILSYVLGYLLGFNWSIKLIIVIVIAFIGYFGYPKILRELNYQSSFVNESLPPSLSSYLSDLDITYESKPLILEFWNSGCGACIRDFPKFDKLYLENSDNFQIYSVNVPWPRDEKINFDPEQFVADSGYTFPVITMNYDDAKKIGVNLFPTALIIQNGRIKYRGLIRYYESDRYNFIKIAQRCTE